MTKEEFVKKTELGKDYYFTLYTRKKRVRGTVIDYNMIFPNISWFYGYDSFKIENQKGRYIIPYNAVKSVEPVEIKINKRMQYRKEITERIAAERSNEQTIENNYSVETVYVGDIGLFVKVCNQLQRLLEFSHPVIVTKKLYNDWIVPAEMETQSKLPSPTTLTIMLLFFITYSQQPKSGIIYYNFTFTRNKEKIPITLKATTRIDDNSRPFTVIMLANENFEDRKMLDIKEFCNVLKM